MKQINKLFSPAELIKDHRSIKERSDVNPRKYNRIYKPYTDVEKLIYNPVNYRFRLLIFFNDQLNKPGYKGTWIKSIDRYKGFIDEWTGLFKLERRIKKHYFNKYTRAIIYINIDGDFKFPVAHYYKNVEQKYLSGKKLLKVPFVCVGNNHLVNLKHHSIKDYAITWSKST